MSKLKLYSKEQRKEKIQDFLEKFKGKAEVGKKIALASAATIAVGGFVAYNSKDNDKDESYSIVQANDIPGDEYENQIPIKLEDGSTACIDDSEFLIVKKYGNNVTYLSPYDEILKGNVESRYIKDSKFAISEELLSEYKSIYSTVPEVGAYIRSKPAIDDSLIVSSLGKDELVLAGTKYVAANDGFVWLPVLKINNYGIYQGYVRADLLELEGNLKNGKFDKEVLDLLNKTSINKQVETEVSNTKTEETTTEVITPKYIIDQDDYLENINKKVDTKNEENIPLNCRTEPSINSNIITTIEHNSKVVATGKRATNEGREWIEVSFNDSIGWVAESYLKDYIVEKKVDTSQDNVATLNMRKEPGFDGEIILQIESNKNIKILEQNFNNPIECDNLEWIKVKVNEQVGYIAAKYLKDIEQSYNEPNKSNIELYYKIMADIEKNANGTLTGIDVAFANGNTIESLINNGFNQDIVATQYMGTLNNIKDINSSKINFVMIGIGAMNDDCNVINERQAATEAIKKCEELGIPYGLYYYSGCINKEEAQKEYNYITSFMESIKSENLKYNLLPLTIDVEICNENVNRQAGKDVTEQKAILANLLQADNHNVILYTAKNAASTTNKLNGNQCISIPRFKELTGINSYWYVAPRQEWFDSDMSQDCKDFINNTPSDIKVVMQQVILEGNVNNINVDIDTMDVEFFKECIRKSLNIKEQELNNDRADR